MSNKEQGDNRDDCLWGLCNRDESRPAASAITDSVTVAVGAVGYGTRVAAGAIGYGTTTAAAYFMDGTKTVAGAVRDGTVSAAGLLRDGTAAATSAMRDQPTAAVVGTAVAVGVVPPCGQPPWCWPCRLLQWRGCCRQCCSRLAGRASNQPSQ